MKVLIRTDSSVQTGTGHLMRCLILAEELRRRRCRVIFVCRAHEGHLNSLAIEKGFKVNLLPGSVSESEYRTGKEGYAGCHGVSQEQDALETIATLGREHQDLVIVDHYGLDTRWEALLRAHTDGIMVIDDLADRPHECDILLDQNYTLAGSARWKGLIPDNCRLFAGPEYALIRAEFFELGNKMPMRDGTVRRLLIAFGGMDPKNAAGKALDAVMEIQRPDIEVDVVMGGGNPEFQATRNRYSKSSGVRINKRVSNMAELMAKSELAIGAGGTMMWERCILGLPALVIILAENQRQSAEGMAEAGGVVNLGPLDNVTKSEIGENLSKLLGNPDKVKRLGQNSRKIMGGANRLGTDIISDALLEHKIREQNCNAEQKNQKRLNLRLAKSSDCRFLWELANDPSVRLRSLNPEPISWESHVKWFDKKLKDENTVILVATGESNLPIGIGRFEINKGKNALDSIIIRKAFRGKGYGTELIKLSNAYLFKNFDVKVHNAYVKPDNIPSLKSFEKAGYTNRGIVEVEGQKLLHLTFSKNKWKTGF